jgi:hypothetical protein
MNAAEASVPGAQIFEHMYAAAADATAVMTSVGRSIPPPPRDDLDEATTQAAAQSPVGVCVPQQILNQRDAVPGPL